MPHGGRRRRTKKKATPKPRPSPPTSDVKVEAHDEEDEWEEASRRCRDHPEDARWKDEDGHLPIHVACYRRAPLSFVRSLHEAYAEGVKTATNDGRLPIHLACDWSSVDVIEYLHGYHPDGARTKDKYGYTPMDFLWHNDRMSKKDKKKARTILSSRPRARTPPPPPTYPIPSTTTATTTTPSSAGAETTSSDDPESGGTPRPPTTTSERPSATSEDVSGDIAPSLGAESVSHLEPLGPTEAARADAESKRHRMAELRALTEKLRAAKRTTRSAGTPPQPSPTYPSPSTDTTPSSTGAETTETSGDRNSSATVRSPTTTPARPSTTSEDVSGGTTVRRGERRGMSNRHSAAAAAVVQAKARLRASTEERVAKELALRRATEDLAKVQAELQAARRVEKRDVEVKRAALSSFCGTAVADHEAQARKREVLYRERFARDRDELPKPFFESTGRRSPPSVELTLE